MCMELGIVAPSNMLEFSPFARMMCWITLSLDDIKWWFGGQQTNVRLFAWYTREDCKEGFWCLISKNRDQSGRSYFPPHTHAMQAANQHVVWYQFIQCYGLREETSKRKSANGQCQMILQKLYPLTGTLVQHTIKLWSNPVLSAQNPHITISLKLLICSL